MRSRGNINVKTNQTTGTDQPYVWQHLPGIINGAFNLNVTDALNIKSTDATTLTSVEFKFNQLQPCQLQQGWHKYFNTKE